MRYVVKSRGRPIGTTDLGFARLRGDSRMGWFHPNELGERVLPVAMAVPAALREWLDAEGLPPIGPGTVELPIRTRSTAFADLAAALQHAAALELTLHRDDGTLVPTRHLSFQDTERLRAMAEEAMAAMQADGASDDAAQERPAPDLAGRLPELDEVFRIDICLSDTPPSELPRYHVHVMLEDADSIP